MGLSLCLQCNVLLQHMDCLPYSLFLCVYNVSVLWSLCFISASPLCSKPQKVKTFVVEKPALMRAVVLKLPRPQINMIRALQPTPAKRRPSNQEPGLQFVQSAGTRKEIS